jgi:acyl-CoA reductase-like NAD-dependent aldehyde dehydrogenase
VGCIVPFNFPVMVPLWTVPIALVTGNTVVLKPSEKVPSAMLRVAELFKEAGLPDGAFNIVNGTAPVCTALINHPDVRAISFVGSSKVAKIVANSCHALHKRVLALGGAKNHLIALPDCTTMMCAKDITASYAGCAGQRCMAASVLIIVDTDGGEAGDKLLQAIKDTSAALDLGQAAGQVGPLIDDLAVARVDKYVKRTIEQGGECVLDGRGATPPAGCSKGAWCKPTILVHKSHLDDAMQDEIFAPVLSVLRVKTWEEAIAVENANPHGNAASIYTEQGAAAEWFTKRFTAAMLGVNIGIPVPREPFSFGGLYGTDSKFGDMDTTGDGAVEFFTNRIKITSKWAPITAEIAGLPVDVANFDGNM